MAITLTEARHTVKRSVLHCGSTFSNDKLDVGIIRSGMRFMRECGLEQGIAKATTTSGSKELDFSDTSGASATEANFKSWYGSYDRPFIDPADTTGGDWDRIQLVSLDNLRGEYEKGNTTGQPRVMAWVSDTTAWMYPEPDAAYVVNYPFHRPLATNLFSPGTHNTGAWSTTTTYKDGDVITSTPLATARTYRSIFQGDNLNNIPVEALDSAYWEYVGTTADYPVPTNARDILLNVPDQWAYEWLATGVRAAILRGAPGHPDYGEANEAFEELIERVKDATASTGGVWYVDPTSDLDSVYGPQSLRNI